ncbi:MAG: winged helix-turn-helix domain-containing protein, partial [Chloroflexi bacterium]|nr:winged helix-turn-helix domain-containing protein [Chloroflexota bacterium]
NSVTLLFTIGETGGTFLQERVEELEVCLGGRCRLSSTADHDMLLRVSGLKRVDLLPLAHRPALAPPFLPVGLLPSDETLYINWRQLGHVLVASLPGGGADVILTSLLASLTARCRPDELRLWIVARHRALPACLARLPHRCSDIIDPNDEDAVREALATLRAELVRRMGEAEGGCEWRPSRTEPELVLALGELGDLQDDGTTLEMIGTHGPAHGVRLLAGSTRATAVRDTFLCHFSTRFVLQSFDDDESIQMIGRPEAADLGLGEFYLRVGRREPIRVNGFRVAPDHLDELIRLMRDVYGDVAVSPHSIGGEDSGDEVQESPALDGDDVGDEAGALSQVTHESPGATTDESRNETARVVYDDPPMGSCVSLDETVSREPSIGNAPEEPVRDPVIQIRCFGEFSVRSADRQLTPYLEDGPSFQAWELLAFLASQAGMAIARDKLIAALWPRADEEKAANCLRVAMSRLRMVLTRQILDVPPQVVRTDREGICRLDTDLVASDVQQFVTLLEAVSALPADQTRAALEKARSLYLGDLLTSREGRLYNWVDERDESGISLKEHYREQYNRATRRLARLWYQAGRAELAVPLYKELLEAEPTLEDVVRELYRCYGQLGDLGSLIREDRHLREALQETYSDGDDAEVKSTYYQPEAETVALFNEIRQKLEFGPVGRNLLRSEADST